ncbi:MAG: prepilin-type N-terminal cleavage/methylation domain-containing protein [Nitrospinae bacterium]|nr:prepilin-type N-terminal cleavage/methylation domain-containing protein [Nitrospinota bacterium]
MQKKEGFTLVELLIVVAIIGILAAIAIPQFAAYRAKSYCSAVKSDLANLAIAEEAYFTDNNAYTTDPATLVGFTYTNTGGTLVTGAVSLIGISGFSSTATHANCDANNDGTADVFTWDSTAGGMQ